MNTYILFLSRVLYSASICPRTPITVDQHQEPLVKVVICQETRRQSSSEEPAAGPGTGARLLLTGGDLPQPGLLRPVFGRPPDQVKDDRR